MAIVKTVAITWYTLVKILYIGTVAQIADNWFYKFALTVSHIAILLHSEDDYRDVLEWR